MNKEQYNLLVKQNYFQEKKAIYEANGEITWTTFSADQAANKEKVVLLTNDDFKYGTLRVHQPCMLKLTENIIFNPNRPQTWLNSVGAVTNDPNQAAKIDPHRELDWVPNASVQNNAQYFEQEVRFAYTLGFFAAIAVEGQGILINLNGWILKQHDEHGIQQKFYSHIELSDQPFIPQQGPSNFGNILRSANNCHIFNGKLGKSSHHCIHGNGCTNILIEDITCENFEVASIALNGAKNVYLNNIVVNGNNKDIKILAAHSQARFIRQFGKAIQDMNLSNQTFDLALNLLKLELDKAFNAIIFNDGEIPQLFKNNEGVVDGNAYGILFNPIGVAVDNFLEARNTNKANECTNINLFNCNVNSIHNNVREVVTMKYNGAQMTDTAGGTLQFFINVSTKVGDGYRYTGTKLSDTQIELAKIKSAMEVNNQNTSFLGTLNIPLEVQLWKDHNTHNFKVVDGIAKFYDNNQPVLVEGSHREFPLLCNGDAMFHVNKGCIGFKIDGVNGLYMENCLASDIQARGINGSTLCGNYLGSHLSQGKMLGYNGDKCYGAILSACNDIKIENLSIENIESINSSAFGFKVQNESCNAILNNLSINNIKSNIAGEFDNSAYLLPNEPAISRGLCVEKGLFNISFSNINVENIQNNNGNPYDLTYEIRSKAKIN